MSKYAKINSDNIVENIILCDDLQILLLDGRYIKITDSTKDAEIGYSYHSDVDKFVSKKLWDSWSLNEETYEWEAPIQKPSSGNYY